MERCEKHGPYSVICTVCDAEIVEANKPTLSELNSLQCDDEHLVETFGPLEEIELQTTPEIRAEAQLQDLLAVQRSRHYVDHEQHHKVADKILCDLLRAKGYERVVVAFEQLHKYYS